jgi:hypothetical protein
VIDSDAVGANRWPTSDADEILIFWTRFPTLTPYAAGWLIPSGVPSCCDHFCALQSVKPRLNTRMQGNGRRFPLASNQATTSFQATTNIPVIHENAVYGLEQARTALGLAKATLGREIRLGRLRVAKRAGKYLILGSWLLEWIAAGEITRRKGPATQMSSTPAQITDNGEQLEEA